MMEKFNHSKRKRMHTKFYSLNKKDFHLLKYEQMKKEKNNE